MDKWLAITVCFVMACFTALVINACHENHVEAIKCADAGKTWNNNRCWSNDEITPHKR